MFVVIKITKSLSFAHNEPRSRWRETLPSSIFFSSIVFQGCARSRHLPRTRSRNSNLSLWEFLRSNTSQKRLKELHSWQCLMESSSTLIVYVSQKNKFSSEKIRNEEGQQLAQTHKKCSTENICQLVRVVASCLAAIKENNIYRRIISTWPRGQLIGGFRTDDPKFSINAQQVATPLTYLLKCDNFTWCNEATSQRVDESQVASFKLSSSHADTHTPLTS